VIDKGGKILIEDMPTPGMNDDQVLISTHYSLISSGTELGTINKTPLELVKQTVEDPWMRQAVKNLVFSGNIRETFDTMKNELYLYRLIGYSGTGVVLDKGSRIRDVAVGDRVAFAAQGHAEQVSAYANHVVKVPDRVDMADASFVTVGAIALQGIRRSECRIGEWVVIYGLGLVGQMAARLALAAGARVVGIDVSASRAELAAEAGIRHTINAREEDPVQAVLRITGGKGADRTVVCAVSQDPSIANNAMKMTRKQGRVVFIGVVKMDLERMPFFLNELDIVFSRAYGPGSYDDSYEKGRTTYPYAYVRWDEKRNLSEVLRLMEDGRLQVGPLIDAILPLEEAQTAIDRIRSGQMKSVAMLLSYPQNTTIAPTISCKTRPKTSEKQRIEVGVIGVGNFTRNVHVPHISRNAAFRLRALCSATGMTAASAAQLYPADYITTDYREVLKDPDIDMVLIATRHDLHARIAVEAARAGKHIFMEKPVAMTMEEWEQVRDAVTQTGVHFMVGYNRRYSEIAGKAKGHVARQPIFMRYTVNIRHLPDSHWTLDEVEGGGRLLGEADHFFDLMNYFADAMPVDVQAMSLPVNGDTKAGLFNFMVQIRYENQTMGQLLYTSFGGPSVPRERLELFCGDKQVDIVDFKTLRVDGKVRWASGGMGHANELGVFGEQIKGKRPTGDPAEMLAASWISLQANHELKYRCWNHQLE